LIETHSEHLLLRILKRVRQTHLKVAIAQELKINAEDVCVLYFDPSPDGTTAVKRLRITEDGEFMDRWPRGFFGERDQELLDE
jgi:predicted ATPase